MSDPSKKKSAAPRFAVRAILGLRRGMMALMDALTPPHFVVLDRLYGMQYGALLHVVTRARVPELLAQGPLTATELAQKSGLDADALHRILRRLASSGLFVMDAKGRFSNNRVSRVLRRDVPGNIGAMAEHVGIEANYAAYGKLAETARSGKNGFQLATGADVWSWFAAHPVEGALFAASMQALTTEEAPAIAAGYPFGRHRSVCDVAGGRGTLLAEILVRNPKVSGVLFDADYVLAQADEVLGPRGVEERVTRVAGSFFERQIPSGFDAYVLKSILHDWDDAACLRILGNVRAAMAPGATLLVCDIVLPHAEGDYVGSLVDVHMMVVCQEGRERSREDFARLFEASGFALAEVRPLASVASLVVGKAV